LHERIYTMIIPDTQTLLLAPPTTTEYIELVEKYCTCHNGLIDECPIDGTIEAFIKACQVEEFDEFDWDSLDRMPPL
jgi:hypothetical protein